MKITLIIGRRFTIRADYFYKIHLKIDPNMLTISAAYKHHKTKLPPISLVGGPFDLKSLFLYFLCSSGKAKTMGQVCPALLTEKGSQIKIIYKLHEATLR